jgi:hypothetical protein
LLVTTPTRAEKAIWKPNDVFAIPLKNGDYAIGHILDQRMVNTVRIALYNEVISDLNTISENLINDEHLVSLIEVTREQLDYGVWKIIGNILTIISIEKYANEQFRSNKWINYIVLYATVAETFMNAYLGLLPWDKYYDPDYFDKLLVNPSKKPSNLIYKK